MVTSRAKISSYILVVLQLGLWLAWESSSWTGGDNITKLIMVFSDHPGSIRKGGHVDWVMTNFFWIFTQQGMYHWFPIDRAAKISSGWDKGLFDQSQVWLSLQKNKRPSYLGTAIIGAVHYIYRKIPPGSHNASGKGRSLVTHLLRHSLAWILLDSSGLMSYYHYPHGTVNGKELLVTLKWHHHYTRNNLNIPKEDFITEGYNTMTCEHCGLYFFSQH